MMQIIQRRSSAWRVDFPIELIHLQCMIVSEFFGNMDRSKSMTFLLFAEFRMYWRLSQLMCDRFIVNTFSWTCLDAYNVRTESCNYLPQQTASFYYWYYKCHHVIKHNYIHNWNRLQRRAWASTRWIMDKGQGSRYRRRRRELREVTLARVRGTRGEKESARPGQF